MIDLSSPECKLHKDHSVLGHSCSFTQYLWVILAWHSVFVDWLRKRESSHIGDTVHFPRTLRPRGRWIGFLITGLKVGHDPRLQDFVFYQGDTFVSFYPPPNTSPSPVTLLCKGMGEGGNQMNLGSRATTLWAHSIGKCWKDKLRVCVCRT